MALSETMVVTADEMQHYATQMRRYAYEYEDADADEEARMFFAAAGALQGLADQLRKKNEQEGRREA